MELVGIALCHPAPQSECEKKRSKIGRTVSGTIQLTAAGPRFRPVPRVYSRKSLSLAEECRANSSGVAIEQPAQASLEGDKNG